MRWSRLLITAALSLFVIFGLIDAINAQRRGSVRYDRQRFHTSSSSSARPWLDDTVLLESEEQFSSAPRRRIPTSQTAERSTRTIESRSRSRPTKAQYSSRSLETSSEEQYGPRRTTKEQYAPSLRSEVVYQNDFARRSDKGSEEMVQSRRKSRLRSYKNEVAVVSSSTSTTTVASVRAGRKLGNRLGGGGSRVSNEVDEVLPSSSARSVESRSRGKVKAASKERMEEVASDENYPEEFKKLLKAKLQENKLKSTNKLDASTEKVLNEKYEVPRFKVKGLSTTTEGPSTTIKVITPRPVRTFSTTSTEETSTKARTVTARGRVVSTTLTTPRSSKRVTTARSTPSSTSTTSESPSITVGTTPRSARGYSRRPSIVSQLTSTTTTSTTTRKPYVPTTRSSTSNKRSFSTTSSSTVSKEPSESIPKRDNSFVVSSLRNPSAFRSSSSQSKNRKPSTTAELNNDLKPVVIPTRSNVPPPLNTLKRSQASSSSGSRVPNRFDSNFKKTPVYTPTIPSFKATPPTPTQLNSFDDANWNWPMTEPAGLFNRLPPVSNSQHHHRHPTPGPSRWPSYAVAPTPSSSAPTTAYYYQHHSSASASVDHPSPVDERFLPIKTHHDEDDDKDLNDMRHQRVLASGLLAVDASNAVDDDDVVGLSRIRTKKIARSGTTGRQRHRQERRRGARKFTNQMRNDLDYYIASSSSSSSSTRS